MRMNIKYMTSVALVTALLCVLAPITVPLPISPVPISLANFVIYLFAVVIGTKKIVVSTLLYLFIGAVGVPVFSKYSAGIGYVFGPTGGYLLGFLLCAFFTGIFADFSKDINTLKSKIFIFLGMVIGTVLCYAVGTFWLIYSSLKIDSFYSALAVGVLPFIPGDIVKMILCIIIAPRLKSRIKF